MSETQAELRSTINHELFSITDEMKEVIEQARKSQLARFADFEDAGCYEVKNNFRAYDQNQSFFITVTTLIPVDLCTLHRFDCARR